MEDYQKALKSLNPSQREAVETIEGPVLVIAGPGTGKTQLISARVGYILQHTDVEPSNILLLTFTDAGVLAMRQRLERLIPKDAPKIHISTYHGFGNDLIRNNPEYFEGLEGDPIDELAAMTIISSIIESLPHNNPLKAAAYYPKEVLSFISDAKSALLTPADIEKVAKANLEFIKAANQKWRRHLDKLDRISRVSAPLFEELFKDLANMPITKDLPKNLTTLSDYLGVDLALALEQFSETGSSQPLTTWKSKWLEKDKDGRFVIAGHRSNERLLAAAGLYRQFQKKLSADHAFDYDDMILRVIETLQAQPDFKYSLSERYQYIMLDEFQDTNPAQMRLIELLTDHPVHEGRPNVLAVGDDDQAIYAFQGADHANMAAFARIYRDVKLISLKETYRSPQELVDLAAKLAGQISQRLHHSFPGIEKTLLAAGKQAKQPPKLKAREFISDAAQYSWLADQIDKLIKQGTPTNEIAVLAPRHKYLEALLPYLARHKLPVTYERREDVLEDPKIIMLEQMARLAWALSEGNHKLADALSAEVISYDFWVLPTEKIWQLVWQADNSNQPLINILLKDKQTANIAKFFLRLKDLAKLASLEEMLDGLIGIGDIHQKLNLPIKSPFFEHFFGRAAITQDPSAFTNLLSNLNLLRNRIRNRQRRQSTTTHLNDFIDFIDATRAADINILNTSPYHQSKDAVNVLTAYGAKGREFAAVFVIAAQDEVWGSSSRVRPRLIKLPPNLQYISYSGMSEDERLRLFYVAITRAKSQLYLTSYQQTLDGQRQKHLAYLQISEDEAGKTAAVLPAKYSRIELDVRGHIEPETAIDYWTARHLPTYKASLKSLLASRLETYKLSATHLNKFIDIESAGPEVFFIYYLLGLPQAPTPTTAFGTAMHATLSWVGNQLVKAGKLPPVAEMRRYFDRQLEGGWLRDDERSRLRARGHAALPIWCSQIGKHLNKTERFEYNFTGEAVLLNRARLTGKIDRLVFDELNRKVTVVDIKTGRAFRKWESSTKAHKFKQQLMFYKLLIEGSNSFKGYSVDKGVIEFVEPDGGDIVQLEYPIKDEELAKFKQLINAVWQSAQSLTLPDTAKYPSSLKGIKQFEADLTK